MKMRFARGVVLVSAMGLLVTGGSAFAAEPDAVSVKFKQGKSFPTGATRFDGAAVGGKVYFLGFRAADGTSTDGSIWYYDIKQDKYVDTKDKMAVPISNYEVAVLKDKTGTGLYTFGGRDSDGATSDVVQVYYPSSGKSKVIKSDPWPGHTTKDCASLPATGIAVLKNKAFAIGGMSFSTSIPACEDANSNETWVFDPTAKAGKMWSKGPKLGTARGYITPAVVNGTIYAIGGNVNEAGTLTATTVVESMKPGDKSWNDKGVKDLPTGCDESQAFGFDKGVLANTITVAGCGQWPNAVADVLQYDVKKDKWSTVGSLQSARRNHAGENIGSAKKPMIMVVGGYSEDGSTVIDTSEIGKPSKKLVDYVPSAPPAGSQGSSHASVF
jgi:hypothetical protein